MAITTARQWKRKGGIDHHELDLPSGNTALVRRIKPEAFLESGLIPDPLAPIISEAINSKKGMRPEALSDLAQDHTKVGAALEMFDRALVYAVVEPVVQMSPPCIQCRAVEVGGNGIHIDRSKEGYHRFEGEPREPDVLYADDVDLEDKQFIFQYAIGGIADVAKFRHQLESSLADLQSGQGIQDDPGESAGG